MLRHFAIIALLTCSIAHARLTSKSPDLKLSVTNFDKDRVFLMDDRKNRYIIPKKEFKSKKVKVHQKIKVHSEEWKKYKVQKK